MNLNVNLFGMNDVACRLPNQLVGHFVYLTEAKRRHTSLENRLLGAWDKTTVRYEPTKQRAEAKG